MVIKKVAVKNFRLLKDVELSLEDKTTVIVGRNNSGKTSLTELFRRLLSDSSPSFSLEDFSLPVHEEFWKAFLLAKEAAEEDAIRMRLPVIEAKISISYDAARADLGVLGEFIIDLNSASTEAVAVIRYQLKKGGIDSLFEDLPYTEGETKPAERSALFKAMKERVPKLYEMVLFAVDPTDATNRKEMDGVSKLRTLLSAGFINAQRGLDDTTHKERDVLGKVLERLLTVATSETAAANDRNTAKELDGVVQEIQKKIDTDFNTQLTKLLPALKLFGYPGLNDPNIHTETTLDVQRLLGNHTKLRYAGVNGIGLPETYNGLGSRNLIFILFHLFEFFKAFQSQQVAPAAHLVFIEEPEAHLHPQMQEVFIRKIGEIAGAFAKELNGGQAWPVQFIVTTHSTHMANEAPFETIRYFLNTNKTEQQTRVKDLKTGFCNGPMLPDRDFLHKFLTLTRCDLFFADKAILIEGPTERLLMPKMIEKLDAEFADANLGSQYVSVVEVGGAYVHHFFDLLDFLELNTLIITDLDSVKAESAGGGRKASKVADGTHTSNAGIKKWFEDNDISPAALIAKSDLDKIKDGYRIAYQVPEVGATACGRSFEDAFMLANGDLFGLSGPTDAEKAVQAWDLAHEVKKTNFALEYAIDKTAWVVPRYIKEGLKWLAENSYVPRVTTVAPVVVAPAPAPVGAEQ